MVECLGWFLSAIGFDFDFGKGFRNFREEGGEFFLLEEWFTTSEDESVTGLCLFDKCLCDGLSIEGEDLLCLGEFFEILVLPGGGFPIPGKRGVAPDAMEIAKGEA